MHNPFPAAADVLVVIFDGNCGVCTRSIRWMEHRDARGRLLPLPYQKPGVPEQYGLTREQAEQKVWVVAGAGSRWSGAAAVFRIFRELGAPWSWLAGLYALPPIRRAAEGFYAWFSHRRHRFGWFGVMPACEASPDACS